MLLFLQLRFSTPVFDTENISGSTFLMINIFGHTELLSLRTDSQSPNSSVRCLLLRSYREVKEKLSWSYRKTPCNSMTFVPITPP